MTGPVLVVGAGWSGAVTAHQLRTAGVDVLVVEQAPVVGGHSRTETLNGVVYEPNGAHIFHTSNPRVSEFVQRFGYTRPYEHRVRTAVFLRDDDTEPVLLSWPPQVGELEQLADWPLIERELAELPPAPVGDDFESYVMSMMGPRLYRMFIEGYTRKQWGCEPSALSSAIAPKRVELRRDGYTRLFRDTWEYFPPQGANPAIEQMLAGVPVLCGVRVTIDNLESLGPVTGVVITGPLDDFLEKPGELAWRGIRMRSTYMPTTRPDETRTAAYVVNHPSPRVPYTRTVETKHASGQQILGTVVSEELPGADARHYPVATPGRVHEQRNEQLQADIVGQLEGVPVFFCGRLATYRYIDQDRAIEDGFDAAERVLRTVGGRDVDESRASVAVAIPAYNESEGIGEFLTEIDALLAPVVSRLVLVVVDDSSTDGTAGVVRDVVSTLEGEIDLVEAPQNRGHGPTVLDAYRRACASEVDYVLQVDGDGQFLGSDLRRIFVLLDDGAKTVCGVRRFRQDPFVRMIMTRFVRWYVRLGFGLPTRDANCPLRGYRRDVLQQLLDGLPPATMVPNLYLTILAATRGVTMVEVDVAHRVRRGKSVQGSSWGRSRRWSPIPWRLVKFAWAALGESRRFRRYLRTGAPNWTP